MAVETATYIGQLDPTKPAGTDGKAEGDDMLRLLKTVLQAQFTSLGNAAVTATAAQLNSAGARTGGAYTGIHDFTSGTITAATKTAGNNTTEAATTAFVGTAIAGAGPSTGTSLRIESGAGPFTALAGEHVVVTAASAVTVNLPAAPTAGHTVWVTPGNGRTDTVVGCNTKKIMSTAEDLTVDNAYFTVQLRYINAAIGWAFI